jgi:TolB-like protein
MSRAHAWHTSIVVAIVAASIGACAHAPSARIEPARVHTAEAAAREAIANERALRATMPAGRTVAVMPLAAPASDTMLAPLSYGLADLMMTDLAQSRQITVVDRLQLDAMLRELALTGSGRVDQATAPRVGRLIQARQLVVGAVAQPAARRDIALDVRVADVGAGAVRQGIRATAPLDDIFRAEKELVFRLFDQLGVTLSAAERAAIEQRRTASIAALLAYSRGVQLEVQGNYDAAAAQFERAKTLDPAFATPLVASRHQPGPALVTTTPAARAANTRAASTGTTTTSSSAGGTQAARAAAIATERVNPMGSFTPSRPGGGAVDPQIGAITGRPAVIIITITTSPMSIPIVIPR